eukprot:gb/GFBE01020164.1/.p1 GENE.gb/GFBE01020164.1/~~gb/GFBE01020164.1/.p1  ORF type:complete len:437 (+),score=96.27 gb/GFBE01020164.1/:1-1311(+)
MGGCASTAGQVVEQDFHAQYCLGEVLGRGTFGQVRTAWRHGRPEQERAVKLLSLSGRTNKQQERHDCFRQASEENRLWRKVKNHNSFVQPFEAFTDGQLYYMVMEKCSSTLTEKLSCLRQVMSGDVAKLFLEMLRPMAYLHSKFIVHRDIKPDNYMFAETSKGMVLKLGDFGLAAEAPRKPGSLISGCFGTAPYMSPEMASSAGHSMSTDLWSLGAVAYLVVFGEWPYMPSHYSARAVKMAIVMDHPSMTFARQRDPQPPNLAKAFVQKLLVRNANRRCTAKEAMKHPFLPEASASSQDFSSMFSKCCEKTGATGTKASAPDAAAVDAGAAQPDLNRGISLESAIKKVRKAEEHFVASADAELGDHLNRHAEQQGRASHADFGFFDITATTSLPMQEEGGSQSPKVARRLTRSTQTTASSSTLSACCWSSSAAANH